MNFFLISLVLKIDLSFEVLIKYPHHHHRCSSVFCSSQNSTCTLSFFASSSSGKEVCRLSLVKSSLLKAVVVCFTYPHVWKKSTLFFLFFSSKKKGKRREPFLSQITGTNTTTRNTFDSGEKFLDEDDEPVRRLCLCPLRFLSSERRSKGGAFL